jgi:NagD protein
LTGDSQRADLERSPYQPTYVLERIDELIGGSGV